MAVPPLPTQDFTHPTERFWIAKSCPGVAQGAEVPPALDTPVGFFADIQDDQVVEAVSRDKKRELPLEQILVLTEENFHSSLSEAARTVVVLFYASCEYEMWPGCPFCNFGMFSLLPMILETSFDH